MMSFFLIFEWNDNFSYFFTLHEYYQSNKQKVLCILKKTVWYWMISPTSSETFNQIICLETIPCPFFIFIFFFITLFILFASQTWPPPNPPFTQSLPLPLPLLLWQDVVPLGKHSILSIKSAELSTSSLTKVRELSPVRGTGSTDRQQV